MSENVREKIETRLAQNTARLDPQALIAVAIEKGAGIETLERLVTLAKDVRTITAREAWFDAMAEFGRRVPVIKKDSTARIQTRSGGAYSYSYAALDTILAIVQPLLGELGLSIAWRQKHEGQAVAASCVVAHRLGHQEESGFITMPYGADDGRMNPAQRVGSALTYARRYSLLAILGLAPEDDDDAHGTNGKPAREVDGPKDRTTPWNPESPEAKAEAERLFPTPEDDERATLITKIGVAIKAKKLTPQQRTKLKETFLGDAEADPGKADVASLSALLHHIQAAS